MVTRIKMTSSGHGAVLELATPRITRQMVGMATEAISPIVKRALIVIPPLLRSFIRQASSQSKQRIKVISEIKTSGLLRPFAAPQHLPGANGSVEEWLASQCHEQNARNLCRIVMSLLSK